MEKIYWTDRVKNKEALQRAKNDTLRTVTTGAGGGAGTNYRDPAVRKGAQGPTMLRMFLSLSVVSDVIR